jgi:hypothetical protein
MTVLGGILGSDPIDWNEVDRRREADAQREQALQRTLKGIEDAFKLSPDLHKRAMKRAAAEITPEAHKTFLRYQTFCAAWGLPCLPETKREALTLFLAQENNPGRTLNLIATVYRKLNPRPWEDPLTLAVVDASRDDGKPSEKMH